ncbi:hypothetical protein [uncultured Nostoc sp.]|uniref:hypothetical protein n=1 Tax=uncultured Nostoc sp. TaxID=340711 RepID=UPI0035CC985F
MFKIASEWKLIVNEYRANEKAFIPAIEPGINFTSNIIGIFATSPSSPSSWYSAGDFLQLYQVGFGTHGYAQGEFLKIILNRYQIHKFNKISSIENKYLISFLPKFYLKNIDLKVWEYVGDEGATLETLETSIKATHQRIVSEAVIIKALLEKK